MTSHKIRESSTIFAEFRNCSQLQYSGKLSIASPLGHKWNFYYYLGQLVWATGGIHPGRRLRRNITQNCPQINIEQLHLNAEDLKVDYWDYRLLENLHKQNKISKQQTNTIVENTLIEILFDLAQQIDFNSLSWECNQEVVINILISSTNASMSFKQMQELWHSWSEAGLANYSPHLAPVIRKPDQLKQQVSPIAYKNFENLINGKYTLWDLAVKMKQSVLEITRSLLPFFRSGITELVEVPDLPLPVVKFNYDPIQLWTDKTPLIACVDDSPLVCKMLDRIITSNGMRSMSIHNSVEALPILLQSRPDLIFLDLMMPIVNGYELCAQLRRISILKNTPIVILTSSDGLFDQVRSRVYGATDFMTKPVETDRVLAIAKKYLQPASPDPENCNFAFSY